MYSQVPNKGTPTYLKNFLISPLVLGPPLPTGTVLQV